VHLSTRILLVLAAVIAIAAGWWILLAINSVFVGIIYSIVWTLIVVIVARVLIAVGFGYNRFTAGRRGDTPSGSADAAAALAKLADLRERGLISPEEYEAKRAGILDRL
jgi:uncharacterized membrane protein